MKEVSPFTDKLYDHHFDIDMILAALCGRDPVYLDTKTGAITAAGEVGRQMFLLEPLPASFLAEIEAHPKRNALDEAENTALSAFLAGATITDFPTFFEQGFAGGWLRERVKDVALEWLDLNGLIPPSMRHVRDSSAFATVPEQAKVRIE